MECFTHGGTQAVGTCKTCGKAVCRTCAVERDMALACSDACAKEASDFHEMNRRGKKLYGIGVAKKMPSGVIVWGLFALIFGIWGIYQSYRTGEPEWFWLLFSGMYLAIAALVYLRARDVGLQC